jgi:hypothetical protein
LEDSLSSVRSPCTRDSTVLRPKNNLSPIDGGQQRYVAMLTPLWEHNVLRLAAARRRCAKPRFDETVAIPTHPTHKLNACAPNTSNNTIIMNSLLGLVDTRNSRLSIDRPMLG